MLLTSLLLQSGVLVTAAPFVGFKAMRVPRITYKAVTPELKIVYVDQHGNHIGNQVAPPGAPFMENVISEGTAPSPKEFYEIDASDFSAPMSTDENGDNEWISIDNNDQDETPFMGGDDNSLDMGNSGALDAEAVAIGLNSPPFIKASVKSKIETNVETEHSASPSVEDFEDRVLPKPVPVRENTSFPSNKSFEHHILTEHNLKRQIHGAPALKWDDDLAMYAANATLASCDMVHTNGPYGENIFKIFGAVPQPWYETHSAVQAWYDEISLYDFDRPGYSEATGHFTQVVWKAATALGCANRACGEDTIVYCEYDAGNTIGQFEQNVERASL